jgi:RNA polymerase sigma factor (sigma-70 family)
MTSISNGHVMLSVVDLLRGVSARDRAAWEEIMRRYGKLVSGTVRSFRLQEADSLDAVQMTWLRLAENVDRVRSPESLGGWLVTTARRECLQILRHEKSVVNLVSVELESFGNPSASPERQIIGANTTQTLWRLVDELSPRRRAVLRMLFNTDPWPYAEVAHVVKMPLGGIGPTRARALRELRKKLNKHGL